MTVRIEVGFRDDLPDPRGSTTLDTIRSFLGIPATGVRTFDVYLIDIELSDSEIQQVLERIHDPVTQRAAIGRLTPPRFDFVVSVGFRPGVTDAVGKSARSLVQDIIGRSIPEEQTVYTSSLFFLRGVDEAQASRVASELLANPLVQTSTIFQAEQYLESPPDLTVPAVVSQHDPSVQTIPLNGPDEQLQRISDERVLSLSLEEMKAIRDQFANPRFQKQRRDVGLGPDPTDVELECLAQTWSEHCKHKIFNATITYEQPGSEPETINSLFKTFIQQPTERIRKRQLEQTGRSWLVSVFHDNAGVIAFNDRYHLVYKVETHNSPSALDPYGGAMTGIVGVNRDPFGTGLGAELLANVWGYCFATPHWKQPVPEGLLHPRRVRDGVHRGVIDGGNQSGIPYARGWELFDNRYLGKPLVFCGTLGRMPVRLPDGRPTHVKQVHPGDRVVMCGGKIGKDGIHGATFSSAELREDSPVQAVQIGDPITQKKMFDFLLEARDAGLYEAITDNGAGGLSSSVGELCVESGGAVLELSRAPLKYQGLDPWEILISEAQERMTLAVRPEKIDELFALAQRYEVDIADIGEFTDSGTFEVRYENRTVAWLPLEFLHDGLPAMTLRAVWKPVRGVPVDLPDDKSFDANLELLGLLRQPNLSSRENKQRQYDHEVKGLSVVRPLVGPGGDAPSDAAVMLVEHGRLDGVVLAEGVHPYYSNQDTYWATAMAVDEAIRKAVGTGGRLDHMAGLDNYCWPDPVHGPNTPDGHYKLAQLVRSAKALAETCEGYGVPCISGKDSMKNDAVMGGVKISIPPTLLFSVVARIDDVTKAVTMELKRSGALVYLLGITRAELGGSEWLRFHDPQTITGDVPHVLVDETLPLYQRVQEAIEGQLLQSCHALGRGGLAVALTSVAMGGRLGVTVDLDADAFLTTLHPAEALFSESAGRFVVSVAPDDAESFERLMKGLPVSRIGKATDKPAVVIEHHGRKLVDIELSRALDAWKETLHGI